MTIEDKLTAIANSVPLVYDAGKKAEYDSFWMQYQQGGKRTEYDFAFAGGGWNNTTFKPKYDIVVKTQSHMFSDCSIKNLKGILDTLGINFDTSGMTSTSYILQGSTITHFPAISLISAPKVPYLFYSCNALQHIEKVILKDDGSQEFTENYSFGKLNALSYIRFEGKIGKSISFAGSPLLTSESVQSIIDHLLDLTGNTKQTLTLNSQVEVSDEQIAKINSLNWSLSQI